MGKAHQRKACCFHDGFPRAGRRLWDPAFQEHSNAHCSSPPGYAAQRGTIPRTQANTSQCLNDYRVWYPSFRG